MIQLLSQGVPLAIGIVGAAASVVWHYDKKNLVAFYESEKAKVEKVYDAHTTPAERAAVDSIISIVRPLAQSAVPYVRRYFGHLSGPAQAAKAVEHVITILDHHNLVAHPDHIRAEVQMAFGHQQADGTLAASTPAPVTPAIEPTSASAPAAPVKTQG